MTNVILLGITSLLTDFSSEMIVPLLPAFIASVGGTAVAVGFIFGLGDAVAAILRVVSGYWADRTKNYRAFTVVGYAMSAIAKFGYVWALKWPDVAWVRPIERLGKGFRDAPRDAIISESIGPNRRGHAFGIQRAMDSAGAILGSVAVLVLFAWLQLPFRTIFIVSAVIGVFAIAPVLLVRVPKALQNRRTRVSIRHVPPKAWVFVGIATVFAMANFSVALFILAGQASLGAGALAWTLAAYIVFNIVDTVASEPAGALSDRIGRRRTILIGYGLFMLVCLGFAAMVSSGTSHVALLALLFGVYGLFKAFVDASQRAFVSDLSPDEVRGTALGLFETCTGLAAIPAGLIAGALYQASAPYAFVYGAVIAAVAALLLLSTLRRHA
jgi:MFS family permease